MPGAILSIQSHVVYGHVGNSAAVFALQRLGLEVWPIHTVQFSSHAGYPGFKGRAFDAAFVDELVEGLGAVGALGRCTAVLSGYVGKADIGGAILRAVATTRAASPGAVYACDPVIGDDGKGVYVGPGVAEFFRDSALKVADVATPNAFELEYLTGIAPRDAASARAALGALRSQGPEVVVATSLKLDDTPDDAIDLAVADSTGVWRLRTPKAPIAVNGAGDLLSALFLAHWLKSRDSPGALASAATSVYAVVAATHAAGQRELRIVETQQDIAAPRRRFPTEPL